MQHRIEFTKTSGAGNDFVLVNNLDNRVDFAKDALARALCSRHQGIGADGLLLLEPSKSADFFMRYYNADGSYGGMCGNGGRCIARYAYLTGIAGATMTFEALDYLYSAEIVGNNVRLRMKDARDIRTNLLLHVDGVPYNAHFADTGSPHVVIFVDDLAAVPVQDVGKKIRNLSSFGIGGTNVNFIMREANGRFAMRTYERGVEGETLACGTGAVAGAVIGSLLHATPPPINIHVKSGEELVVHFRTPGFSDVVLEGSAHMLFTGTVLYDTDSSSLTDFMRISHLAPSQTTP